MQPKLTCLIPCKNEQHNVRACIESFQAIADEILIADSGSLDDTLDIVRGMGGCRIIQRAYHTSGDFKNWAIPQAKHSWVLLVDADERVTPELADEIVSELRSGPKKDGYRIYRKNYFMGRHMRSCGLNNDWVIRLFHRDRARYFGKTDHARIKLPKDRLGRLKNRFEHYSITSYDQWLIKYDRYARVQAQIWFEEGRKPSYWRLMSRGPLRFLRDYLLQFGVLEGKLGLQFAVLAGYYAFMKQARLWELHTHRTATDWAQQPVQVADAEMPGVIKFPGFEYGRGPEGRRHVSLPNSTRTAWRDAA